MLICVQCFLRLVVSLDFLLVFYFYLCLLRTALEQTGDNCSLLQTRDKQIAVDYARPDCCRDYCGVTQTGDCCRALETRLELETTVDYSGLETNRPLQTSVDKSAVETIADQTRDYCGLLQARLDYCRPETAVDLTAVETTPQTRLETTVDLAIAETTPDQTRDYCRLLQTTDQQVTVETRLDYCRAIGEIITFHFFVSRCYLFCSIGFLLVFCRFLNVF